MNPHYKFTAELWIYSGGSGAWHFVTLPKEYTAEINTIAKSVKEGFGSVKVLAGVGDTEWRTFIVPDSKAKSYILPVKKEIRKLNDLQIGDKVSVRITLDHLL